MSWLAALRRETDIIAPVAVANRNQQLVTTLSSGPSETAQPICTLMEWVEGRCFSDRRTPSRAFRAGDLLARIHRHGETWVRPQNWTRPRQDTRQLDEHLEIYHKAVAGGLLTANDLMVIEEATGRIRAAMTTVGQGVGDFGLIHGDFHRGNYVFHRGEVRPIDFSFCGDGYYLADLAYGMKGVRHPEEFLEGYQRIRPLPVAHLPLIETFIVDGMIGEVAYHLSRPQPLEQVVAFLPRMIAKLSDQFLKGEHSLRGW